MEVLKDFEMDGTFGQTIVFVDSQAHRVRFMVVVGDFVVFDGTSLGVTGVLARCRV